MNYAIAFWAALQISCQTRGELTKLDQKTPPSFVDDQPETLESKDVASFCTDDVYGQYLREEYKSKNAKSSTKNAKRIEQSASIYAKQTLEGQQAPYLGGIPIVDNHHVQRWMRHFKGDGRPTYLKWLIRAESYRDLVIPILQREGIPTEFFYLAMIESGFSNSAASVKSATGTWQFMKGTAKLYHLRIDHWVDERRDPVKSTIAAANYLRDLYTIFGDWYLAMAAYNAGPGKVKKAIHHVRSRDFWKLAESTYLRPETKNYVPKMLAAFKISHNFKEHGFDVVEDGKHHMPLSSVEIDRPISLRETAQQLEISENELRFWNPELTKDITPPRRTYALRMPEEVKEKFAQIRDQLSSIEVTDIQLHRIHAGETLSSIARRYKVDIAKIRELNPQISAKALKIGREIAIPIPGVVKVSQRESSSKSL